jgi:hypothetical protein
MLFIKDIFMEEKKEIGQTEQVQVQHKGKRPNVKSIKLDFLNNPLILGAIVVVLVIAIYFAAGFFANQSRFSFTINGLNYQSDVYTPSEFFDKVKASDNFIVSMELVDRDLDVWSVNARQLWIVALVSDKKSVLQVVKSVDTQGNLQYCSVNDSNILSERRLEVEECSALLADTNYLSINIKRANSAKAVLYANSVDIFVPKGESATWANYSFIKNVYPDFDRTLQIFQEMKDSVNKVQ